MALTIVVREKRTREAGDGDKAAGAAGAPDVGGGQAAPRPPLSITLDAPRVIIGRGEGCEVRLPDASVSHRHASIRQRGAEYIVLDEGSANGTFVGPVRLSPQAPRVLTDGDL